MEATPEAPTIVRETRPRRPAIVGPAILIGLGLLFLGQNLGLVPYGVWENVWRLWPLVLVLIGLELLFGRGSWLSALAILFVVLVIGGLATVALALPVTERWESDGRWGGTVVGTVVERVGEDLNDTRQATIDLRHNAGRLNVVALPSDSEQLVQAELDHPENTAIYKDVQRNGGTTEVRLRDPDKADFPFVPNTYSHDWTVALSPRVPLDLRVESGASAMDLDLSNLQVASLDIKTGAAGVKVTLPQAAGRTTASIHAGAAGIDVTVPEGVAARIHANGALSGLTIDQSRFPRSNGHYQSPNYDTATNRVDLNVDAGVSGVTIR